MRFYMKENLRKNLAVRIIAATLLIISACGLLGGCKASGKKDFSLPTRKITEPDSPLKFGSYTYLLYNDGTAILTSYSGDENSILIPDVIDGKTVIALDNGIFAGNETLQSVNIGSNIEIIGDFAFYACKSLRNVSVGKNVWYIGAAAFDDTPWMNAKTDEYVIAGDGVLLRYNGKDKYVTVPDGIKHLSSAFGANYDIIYVELGDSVLTLGKYSFASCESLRQVKFGKNIKLIGDNAFEGCVALSAVDIPDSVERIGDHAFDGDYYLMTARIGNSVSEIGQYAFNQCIRMRSIALPATLTSVGVCAFRDCFSLYTVFYGGNEEQFRAIGLSDTNYILKDAYKIWGVKGGGHGISD